MNMNEVDEKRILEVDRNSQRRDKKNLVGTPDEGGEVGKEGLLGLGATVKGGKGVEIAPREDAITRQGRAVIDRPRREVDPEVAVLGSPESARASSKSEGGVAASTGTVGVGVRLGLGAKIEEVYEVRVPAVLLAVKIVLDDGIDDGEGNGVEGGGVEIGRGGGEVGADGF